MARRDEASEELLLNTLRDFTSKENWDKFFTIRGGEDPFEWYAEWASLRDPILSQLSVSDDVIAGAPSPLQILVPGCGNSRLSEHLYDAGFRGVTNIDFSKVVVSDMLRRNVRSRPEMRWRVMDMTQMQFTDESFDAVLDKGGLDALMEPELGPKLGSRYVSEVKRVLKSGGKFVCLTLAESHVLGLLFSKFRFGWKINIHAIPHTPSKQPSFQTFMVVVVKDQSTMLHEITSSFNCSSLDCDGTQVRGLFQALDSEHKIRRELSLGADILFSLEDLQLGAKGDLKVLIPGRRFQLLLGEEGGSLFSYKAVLLDAKEQSDPFIYHCGVFLVPKIRAHEWLLSSEEGQWLVVESSKAARLIMVFLDARHTHASMDEIQKDLSPLVKGLAPREQDNGVQIPFMMANDGVKQRDIIHQVTSAMTGQIVVEDVIYEKVDGSPSGLNSSKDMTFRRLIFERNLGVLQSEALLMTEGFLDNSEKKRKTNSMSKSKRKGSQRRSTVAMANGSRNTVKVDHQYLASSYHTGIISGFMLVASNLERLVSSRQMAKTVVIGLGAGLLPMFLHGCMPCLTIEVVELDPIIVNLARDYFGFNEDEHLKVHVADGIEFIRKLKNITASTRENVNHENDETISKEKFPSANGNDTNHLLEGKDSIKIDILIVDVDSSDSSSGMTCPHADFVEESFLLSVKESLSEGGLFVVNLVSRSPTIREMVISRMKAVFRQLFCLQIEEDVNEVLFALPSDLSVTESFSEAALQLQKLLKFTEQDRDQNILATTKKIKHLR